MEAGLICVSCQQLCGNCQDASDIFLSGQIAISHPLHNFRHIPGSLSGGSRRTFSHVFTVYVRAKSNTTSCSIAVRNELILAVYLLSSSVAYYSMAHASMHSPFLSLSWLTLSAHSPALCPGVCLQFTQHFESSPLAGKTERDREAEGGSLRIQTQALCTLPFLHSS